MPRRNKGPRLWLKPGDRKAGKVTKQAVWCIKDDGGVRIVTGCSKEDRGSAEKALADYIAAKHRPSVRKNQALTEILVTDVLNLWAEKVVTGIVTAEKTMQRLLQLGEWWEGKSLDDVDGDGVDAYVAWRTSQPWKSARPEVTGNKPRMVTPQGARRELEDLRAAINWHRARGYHRVLVEVPLPPKGRPRENHLERYEVARLLLGMWRLREMMTIRPGTSRAGEKVQTKKRPHRHLTRFTLLGIYTGTRAAAIASAAFEPIEGRSWLDLETGLFHRLAIGKRATNKRQPPVKLPDRLLAHIRRWKRLGISKNFVVEFNGEPVVQVNKGFAVAMAAAGLKGTPHILRHTCATWLLQRGVKTWDAAGFLGMSEKILIEVYGHWAADFQAGIAGGKKRERPAPELHDVFSTHYNRDKDIRIARTNMMARLERLGIPYRGLRAAA